MKRPAFVIGALALAALCVAPAASAAGSTGSTGSARTTGSTGPARTTGAAVRTPTVHAAHENWGATARPVLAFDSMTPVTEPFVGTSEPVRGVPGGGLPWELRHASGVLRADGRVDVVVRGLVLARRDPVPVPMQGTNPIASFRVLVSCLTTRDGVAATVNQSTDPAPASPRGDALIRGRVDLPSPCIAPIVFVTSPTGAWFATTGA